MITFFYAGILGLFYVALAFYTIKGRFKHRIALGDGDNDDMLRRIRVHANFAEYVPLALILMALAETMISDLAILHIAGITLILSRLIFSLTVLNVLSIPKGRQIGMILTLTVIIVLSVVGIYMYLSRL